jgi:hypothetical protein
MAWAMKKNKVKYDPCDFCNNDYSNCRNCNLMKLIKRVLALKKENTLLNKFIDAECLELHEDMGGCPADSYADMENVKLEICPGCNQGQAQSVKCWREILLSHY